MNIYVGNLSFDLTDEEFNEVFTAFGEVTSAKIIRDHETQRSRGFGFVEMPNAEEAQKAIDSVEEIKGRKAIINEARPKREGGPRREGGWGNR